MQLRCVVTLLFALVFFSCERLAAQTPVWSQLPNSPSGTSRHDDIYMLDATTGWTARGRASPNIFKTTDGGNTWVAKLTKSDTHFRCIGFASATHGFAG